MDVPDEQKHEPDHGDVKNLAAQGQTTAPLAAGITN
jgi:hypothetical protein